MTDRDDMAERDLTGPHDPERCEHCQRNRAATTPLHRPPAWVADAVFYQIFPDRFAYSDRLSQPGNLEPWDSPPSAHGYKGGDLLGVVERLDYLTDLGIDAIYLNPIFQSASNHRYHTHDYLHVDPLLGGTMAFDELLGACHARGIRVILDGVFNHASRGFYQFADIAENGPQSPWRDWFIVHDYPIRPYAEDQPPGYEAWWGMHALPKFNTDNPQVREFLFAVAEHWTRRGIDGWRLDVPQEIRTDGFWEEFRARVKHINPDAYLVGEIWDDAPGWMGTRFDGIMHYQLGTAIIAYAAAGGVNAELELDNPTYSFTHPADAAWFARRIDELRDVYTPETNLAHLVLLDSHDTARVTSILGSDPDSLRIAAALLLAMPGAPCLYYGTEIGLEGGKDPDNRRSFPWDEERWDRGLRAAWRRLISLRRHHPALRSPHVAAVADGDVVVIDRRAERDRVVVAANATTRPADTKLETSRVQLLWEHGGVTVEGGTLHLPGRSVCVVDAR